MIVNLSKAQRDQSTPKIFGAGKCEFLITLIVPKLMFMSQKHVKEENTRIPAFVALRRVRLSILSSGRTSRQKGAAFSDIYLAVN
jgi:hypothetical protein